MDQPDKPAGLDAQRLIREREVYYEKMGKFEHNLYLEALDKGDSKEADKHLKRSQAYYKESEKARRAAEQHTGEKWLLVPLNTVKQLVNQKDSEIADLKAELEPKATFFDRVAQSPDVYSMSDTAKTLKLGYGRNELLAKLRDMGILDQSNIPYQQYIDQGYFEVDLCEIPSGEFIPVTKVTSKGLSWLDSKLQD